jgi:hypothetical protein
LLQFGLSEHERKLSFEIKTSAARSSDQDKHNSIELGPEGYSAATNAYKQNGIVRCSARETHSPDWISNFAQRHPVLMNTNDLIASVSSLVGTVIRGGITGPDSRHGSAANGGQGVRLGRASDVNQARQD